MKAFVTKMFLNFFRLEPIMIDHSFVRQIYTEKDVMKYSDEEANEEKEKEINGSKWEGSDDDEEAIGGNVM